jgi:outer membrane protein
MKHLILLISLLFPFLVHSQDTLRLDEAIGMALMNNYSIIIASNASQVAANSNTIGNAGFLPTAEITAGYQGNITNSQQKYFDGRERTGTNAKSTGITAGVGIEWTLFDGLAMFTNKEQLAELEKLGDVQARMMVENTVADVILNYYAIVQYERMTDVLRQAIDLSMERRRLAEVKLKLGSGSELDLMQAIIDMHADSSQLIQQENLIKSIQIQLNKLLVRDVAIPFRVARQIPYSDTLRYESILRTALAQNPGLIEARVSSRISQLDIRQAKSPLWPMLGVYGGYNYAGSNSQTGFISNNLSYGLNYGITASLNLFNGTKNLTNIKNAKIWYENAGLAEKQTELNLRGDVLLLYNDYRTALMLVKFEHDNLLLARENTRIAFEKYNLGAMNDIDLRTIQQKQLDAERRLLTAQYQAKSKEVELQVLSGTILEK